MTSTSSLADELVADILRAYHGRKAPDRMVEEVLYTSVPTGANPRNYTVKLFLKPDALMYPALKLKTAGPAFLAANSLGEVAEMLRKFLYYRYPIVWLETRTEEFDGSLYELVSSDCRAVLANALLESPIFDPNMRHFAFPITPLVVESDFESEVFNLIDVHSIVEGSADQLLAKYLVTEEVGGWLIVNAASKQAAKKSRRIFLGGLALCMDHQHRHLFTLRKVATGLLQFPGRDAVTVSSSEPHTPPLGSPITIKAADHPWLSKLSAIATSSTKSDKVHAKALEYYYKAWFMDESDRCLLLIMALDAIFGQTRGGFAVGIKEGVKRTLADAVEEKRLDSLLLIRNAMLHGGAPDIFASSKYLEYAKHYAVDPSTDIQLLVAKCLRREVFGEAFRPQDNPDAAVIAQAQRQGLIAELPERDFIVCEWP